MNLLPWPDSYLAAAGCGNVQHALHVCTGALERRGLPGTLLLIGEPGLGREALAVELAAAMICRDGGAGCTCHACERVRRGIHPDLTLLAVQPGATEIKIKQVREELLEGLSQLPYEGARRVVIIASCHTPPLNHESASALLKALEEPPSHLTFLLLASNPMRVLPTIVSRCVRLRLRPPSSDELVDLLAARHGTDPGEVAALLDEIGLDPGLLLDAEPEALRSTGGAVDPLLPAALDGDAGAVVRLAALVGGGGPGLPLLVDSLLRSVATGNDASVEQRLDAAAALLRAEHRRNALHLNAGAVAASTLAGLARTAHR